MNKIAIVAIVGIAFLAGGIIGNADLVAEAAGGDASGAWARLVARVTGLENQLDGNSIRTVILHDDDAGHAAGWNPDGSNTVFVIIDSELGADSIVYAQVAEVDAYCTTRIPFESDGQMLLSCVLGSNTPQEGQTLRYVVVDPST